MSVSHVAYFQLLLLMVVMMLFVGVKVISTENAKAVKPNKNGCRMGLLPETVDWCNQPLDKRGQLPENTVCQSMFSKETDIVLICSNSRWVEVTSMVKNRAVRSLGPVLAMEFNFTCLLFCDGENITDPSALPPVFTHCPGSVTLYPERGSTEVTYSWTEPTAIVTNGNFTEVQKIFGANSSSSFESSVSPGTRYMISYLATDHDNKNWTCTFTVTAEIPTCSPIVYLENGVLNCTDDNLRASVCEFSCYHGYQLNASGTVECQDNGTWSGENMPQCLPVICDGNINSTPNDSRLDFVCENVTGVFGDVCWVTCRDNFRLRNDMLEAYILNTLNNAVEIANQSYESARNEVEISRNEALETYTYATVLADLFESVRNTTRDLKLKLENTTSMANETSLLLTNKVEKLTKAKADLEVLLDNNVTDVNSLENTIADLEKEREEYNTTLEELLAQIKSTEEHLNKTRIEATETQDKLDEAEEIARVKESIAKDAERKVEVALSELEAATRHYENASDYATSGGKVVATYVTCNGSGHWHVQGQPYCEDFTAPHLKCVPVYTFYLDPNQTSGVITWPEPEVDDNSKSATVRHVAGPSPGDRLTSGRHVVKYVAVDDVNNTSPVCTVVINGKEVVCEDLGQLIGLSSISYKCASFQLGATCSLSCDPRDVIRGPDRVTCTLNVETGVPSWNWENTTCISENCSSPAAPLHGYVNCNYEDMVVTNVTDGNVTTGNVTSNRTEETFVCEFSCAEGYMLPYATLNRYTCTGNDVWNSEYFPVTCTETGTELYTQYSFLLKYGIQSCDIEEIHELALDWTNVLTEEVTSFPACMSGFLCDVGDVSYQCNSDNTSVTVTYSIRVSCEVVFATALPWEASCDLTEDKMASLMMSQEFSVSIQDFIEKHIPTKAGWSVGSATVPECEGSVLIGSYCARCPPGSFYSRPLDLCFLCPVGSYSDTPGRYFCTSCPQGQSTLEAGSVYPEDCRDMCRAGSYSNTSIAPCSPCPTGTYQGYVASVMCSPCPAGLWTQSEGSTSLSDCIAFDLYFDDDVMDIQLTSVGEEFSVVLWTSSLAVTSVTLGLFDDTGDHVFVLEVSETPTLCFDGWDSDPVDLDIESDMWTMIGVTWSAASRDVHVYQDGEHVYNMTVKTLGPATQLRLSAGNQTFVSGLSISNSTADGATISGVYNTCGTSLPAEAISLDHIAGQRLPHVNCAVTSCRVAIATPAQNYCDLHTCFNGGECNTQETGYRCTCPYRYGGPTCVEELIHGGWSEWRYDDTCSRTCGHGTRLRFRSCDSPTRSNYGDDCPGNSTEITPCFLGECPECEDPIIEGIGQCDLHDDLCESSCPLGYVLPRGQQKQKFQCGQSTNFTWHPFQRLPICSASFKPAKYSVKLSLEYESPMPCSDVTMATEAITHITSELRCSKDNTPCTADIKLSGCTDGRKKRATHSTSLAIVLSVPLSVAGDFNLPLYYETGEVAESLLKAMTTLTLLESTVKDVQSDLDVFSVTIDTATYPVAKDTFTVSSRTHCVAGFVPVEAVCAQCQKGTYIVGDECRYCPRGEYQNETGQSACVPCPSNQETWTIGSRNSMECIVPPPSPVAEETSWILIVAVVGGVGFLAILLALCIARYLYVSARDRKRYDLEVDRISLYTDFPDLSYNIYFKRRQVVGFDCDGFPVVQNTRSQNGGIKHSINADDENEDSDSVDSNPQISPTREHLAYPEPESSDTPFSYDPCRAAWNDNYVIPYEYPEMDQRDFPKIAHAVRYRIPGRSHLQNIYPLSQFGLDGELNTRTRKHLPLPANVPVPKKLPQLMHRPEEKLSLAQIFKQKFGIQSPREKEPEQVIEINAKRALMGKPQIPPLPFKNKPTEPNFQHPPPKPLVDPTPFVWARPTRGEHAFEKGQEDSGRLVMAIRKKVLPAISTASAFSPRSLNDLITSPYRASLTKSSSKPVFSGNIETIDHGKSDNGPSEQITQDDDPTSTASPFDAIMSDRSVKKIISVGKSVTIREDLTQRNRPLTTLSNVRPTFGRSSAFDIRNSINRPGSCVTKPPVDAVKTISALPMKEVADAYRPVSVARRALTPVEHPKPALHPEVAMKRAATYTLSTPQAPLEYSRPPSSFRDKLIPTPQFVNERDFAERRRRDVESRVSFDMDGGIETLVGGLNFSMTDMTSQPPESTTKPSWNGNLKP